VRPAAERVAAFSSREAGCARHESIGFRRRATLVGRLRRR
jgi:hypothetical protein